MSEKMDREIERLRAERDEWSRIARRLGDALSTHCAVLDFCGMSMLPPEHFVSRETGEALMEWQAKRDDEEASDD